MQEGVHIVLEECRIDALPVQAGIFAVLGIFAEFSAEFFIRDDEGRGKAMGFGERGDLHGLALRLRQSRGNIGKAFKLRDDFAFGSHNGGFQSVGHGLGRLHEKHAVSVRQRVGGGSKVGEASGLEALALHGFEFSFQKHAVFRDAVEYHEGSL